MHNPQAFLSNLVYGEAFETTNGLKSGWGVYLDGSATGSGQLDPGTPFSVAKRPSMHVSFTGGAGAVRLAHRGMGNEGLAFNGSQPYEGYIFARANAPTTVTVALREISSGTTLASAPLAVPGGGAWTQLSFTLTPSSSTTCVDGSGDPTVDCNSGGFPDYQCIKCGGELSFALTAPGDVWVGYARLDVGPWGRVPGVPLRADAFATLKSMGVTVVRYGGSVGSSVNWKDFRGPVYNRTGLGRTWASCDLSGWGPFDAMNAFEAMGINVAVTMADTQSVQDWADLVEYSVGDASTTWGALRIADGHPGRYEPLAWEL